MWVCGCVLCVMQVLPVSCCYCLSHELSQRRCRLFRILYSCIFISEFMLDLKNKQTKLICALVECVTRILRKTFGLRRWYASCFGRAVEENRSNTFVLNALAETRYSRNWRAKTTGRLTLIELPSLVTSFLFNPALIGWPAQVVHLEYSMLCLEQIG